MAKGNPPSICAAILAAGQSRRFGTRDKLVQPLGGMMLGLHAAKTISGLHCANRVVIASAGDHPCAQSWRDAGFVVVVNADAAEGLGTSVALAAEYAASVGADALLICLADMPFVPRGHLEQLIQAFGDQKGTAIFASGSGASVSPPAIFGQADFAQLSLLSGNDGARALLAKANTVPLSADHLADIDTIEEYMNASTRQSDLSP